MMNPTAAIQSSPDMRNAHAEYARLTGYVSDQYAVEWEDENGNLWRKTCTVINLGRPDRGVPVDPDEAIKSERWPKDYRQRIPRKPAVPPVNAAQERTVDYLRKFGPSTIPDIAGHFGLYLSGVQKHLTKREGHVYERVGKRGRSDLWGLIGVHDAD